MLRNIFYCLLEFSVEFIKLFSVLYFIMQFRLKERKKVIIYSVCALVIVIGAELCGLRKFFSVKISYERKFFNLPGWKRSQQSRRVRIPCSDTPALTFILRYGYFTVLTQRSMSCWVQLLSTRPGLNVALGADTFRSLVDSP